MANEKTAKIYLMEEIMGDNFKASCHKGKVQAILDALSCAL